eukprot:gene16102-biopygen8222
MFMLPQGPLPQGPLPQGPLPQGPLPQGPLVPTQKSFVSEEEESDLPAVQSCRKFRASPCMGEQDTGAGVARAWRGRGAGYRQFWLGVARAWRGYGAGMSCSTWGGGGARSPWALPGRNGSGRGPDA